MGRFSIERPFATIALHDRAFDDLRTLTRAEAIDLRDLLVKEFPPEPAQEEPTTQARPCRLTPDWVCKDCGREVLIGSLVPTNCPGGPTPQPDPDEVRRLIARYRLAGSHLAPVFAAAAAWLRDREQQPIRAESLISQWERKRVAELRWLLDQDARVPDAFPSEDSKTLVPPLLMMVRIVERVIHANHTSCFDGCDMTMPEQQPATPAQATADKPLTIEQVITACGDGGRLVVDVTGADERWIAFTERWVGTGSGGWNVLARAFANTPEAAIQALGTAALEKIRERVARDSETLRKCGGGS